MVNFMASINTVPVAGGGSDLEAHNYLLPVVNLGTRVFLNFDIGQS